MQDTVSRLFKNGLAEGIETILDDVANPDEVIRIEKLVITLEGISSEDFERDFKEKFLAEFKSKLAASVNNARQVNDVTGAFLTRTASVSAAFFYFLQHGVLPWYAAPVSISEWEQEILSSLTINEWQQLVSMLKQQYRDNPAVLERFTLQFSDALLTKALLVEIPSLRDNWTAIYNDIQRFVSLISKRPSRTVRDELWLSAWQLAFSFTGGVAQYIYEIVTTALAKLSPETPLQLILQDDKHGSWWPKDIQHPLVKDVVERIVRDFAISENTRPENKPAAKAGKDTVNDVEDNNSKTVNEDKTAAIIEGRSADSSRKGKTNGEHEEDVLPGQPVNIDKSANSSRAAASPGFNPSGKKSQEPNEENLFVQNSGIVLLHPFLMMYFKELGLLTADNRFGDEVAQKRAVLLLHYLTTGLFEAAEYDLALLKVLCGLPLDEAVPAYIELTEQELEESASLLQAVTQHWQPLNKTSAEGLQVTFLQREGKLSRSFAGWRLQIEQKTVDILLGKLPWSYSTIRLPWMNGIINVDWYQ